MKPFRKLFRSLSAKIMAVQLAIVLSMSLWLYSAITDTLSSTLREGVNDIQLVRMQLVGERLDDVIEQCENIARMFLADDVMQETLARDNALEPTGTGAMRTTSLQQMNTLFQNYRVQYRTIRQLYIVNERGDACMLYSGSQKSEAEKLFYGQIAEADWFRRAASARGYEQFYAGDVFGLSGNVFSCVKRLNSTTDFEPLGLMVINFSTSMLNNALRTESPHERILLRDGMLDGAALRRPAGSDASLVTQTVNRRTGWTIEYATSQDVIAGQVNAFRARANKWLLLFAALMAMMFVIVVLYATIPLRKLRNAIVGAREGEYRPDHTPIGGDEVSQIRGEFQRLMDERVLQRERIDQLEIQQMDAQLHLLQEQINPHFLYNTLDSIYWKAEKNGQEDIARMIEALSNTFKIRLSKGMDEIPVQDEVHFIEEYMYIQRERFGDRLRLDVQVSAAAMSCKVLKLILQPFIENAVYHGLEPKVDGGVIHLRGYVEGDGLIFEISDNGVGLEDRSRFYNGFGIKNVMERIRLRYGDGYGVTIDSEAGRGTMATIRLPKGGS